MILNVNYMESEDDLIKIDNTTIEIVKSKKHLGFVVDDKLNLHEHE